MEKTQMCFWVVLEILSIQFLKMIYNPHPKVGNRRLITTTSRNLIWLKPAGQFCVCV